MIMSPKMRNSTFEHVPLEHSDQPGHPCSQLALDIFQKVAFFCLALNTK